METKDRIALGDLLLKTLTLVVGAVAVWVTISQYKENSHKAAFEPYVAQAAQIETAAQRLAFWSGTIDDGKARGEWKLMCREFSNAHAVWSLKTKDGSEEFTKADNAATAFMTQCDDMAKGSGIDASQLSSTLLDLQSKLELWLAHARAELR